MRTAMTILSLIVALLIGERSGAAEGRGRGRPPRRAPAAAPDPQWVAAREYVRRGLMMQDAGHYEQAIALYQQAYALIPHPEILFDLAQAHRLLGRPRRALGYYRQYLALEPEGRVSLDAREWSAVLEALLVAARMGAAAEPDDRRAHTVSARGALVVAAVAPDAPEAAGVPMAAAADTAPGGRGAGGGLRLGGAVLASAGLVSLAVAAKLHDDASAISDDLSSHHGRWTDALLARQAEGERAERQMRLFAGVGLGALIGGGLLYLVGRSLGEPSERGDRNPAVPSLAPAPAPAGDGALLLVGGSF